jgi:hypothetical protein
MDQVMGGMAGFEEVIKNMKEKRIRKITEAIEALIRREGPKYSGSQADHEFLVEIYEKLCPLIGKKPEDLRSYLRGSSCSISHHSSKTEDIED